MTFLGVLIFSIFLIFAISVIVSGVIVLRKKVHWFIRTGGAICFLLGIGFLASVIIAFVMESNPIPALLIQAGIAVALTAFLFWVAMLIECATQERNENERLLWALIIILTGLVGALVYLLVRRPSRIWGTEYLISSQIDKE